jgi:hypothetical protein
VGPHFRWTGTSPELALRLMALEGRDAMDRPMLNDIGKRLGKALW